MSTYDERARHFGSDPDALQWARERAQAAIDKAEAMAAHLASKGDAAKADGYRGAIWRISSLLIGGEGCSVGAFDPRMADFYATSCIHGHLLDDKEHRC